MEMHSSLDKRAWGGQEAPMAERSSRKQAKPRTGKRARVAGKKVAEKSHGKQGGAGGAGRPGAPSAKRPAATPRVRPANLIPSTSYSATLSRLIKEEFERLRSFNALEQEIGRMGGGTVSRRQLKSLAEGRPARLSTSQFDALDVYCKATRSRSLLAVLSAFDDRLLPEVARTDRATIILGERPVAGRDSPSLSRWDFDSMAEFLRSFYYESRNSSTKFDFMEARLRAGRTVVTSESYEKEFELEPWFNLLKGDLNPIICFGSPRSSHAAEYMLARMFKVEPFARRTPEGLPFYFGWATDAYFQHQCSFVQSRDNLPGPAGGEDPPWANRSVIAGEMVHEVRGGRTGWKSYGVSAVQRRGDPTRIWAVFCGLSGPETRGAARLAGQLDLPPLPEAGPSGVAWAVSETSFQLSDPGNPLSSRIFESSRIVQRGVTHPE